MKKKDPVWDFFASVKLALFTISILAITSIVGTVIPQKKSPQWYAQEYGDVPALFFNLLDIPDMYNSWWFLGLLGLLCSNLIICSLDRFPGVWQKVRADGRDVSLKRLEKMARKKKWQCKSPVQEAVLDLSEKLTSGGWKKSQRHVDDGTLLFTQKGVYSRMGVFMVHASILVIFVGAIIGELYGFKGNVMIGETEQIDKVYASKAAEGIPLGFTVRCDSFGIELYNNGSPREYRSELTLLENGKALVRASLKVNDPLTYRGITFYQSSYKAYQNFIIKVTNLSTGNSKTDIVPFQEERKWPQEGLFLGVINAERVGQSVSHIKMWFSDGKGKPAQFWLKDGTSTTVDSGNTQYLISAKQMYATGLQVNRDPGVWVVYVGFCMLLLGLVVAFFMSHKRIWLFIKDEEGAAVVLFVGSTNKNRVGFDNTFNSLAETLQE